MQHLGSHTSLELAGFNGFAREATQIHLIVQRGSRATPMPGVRLHESRRLRVDEIVHMNGLPRTETARSVLDAAAWQPYPRFACLMVAAAVQQRVTTAAHLDAAMRTVGRIRHEAYLRLPMLPQVPNLWARLIWRIFAENSGWSRPPGRAGGKMRPAGGGIWIPSGICQTARLSYLKSTVDTILRWRTGRPTLSVSAQSSSLDVGYYGQRYLGSGWKPPPSSPTSERWEFPHLSSCQRPKGL